MADTLRIKRRAVGGAAGPPATLASAEIAFNEQDNTLYYGKGNSGGLATSIISIGGPGAYLPLTGGTLTGALSITGNTGATDSAVLNVDAVSSFATAAKFGPSLPLYIVAAQPGFGYNTYWNAAWLFGKGSVAGTNYGGLSGFNTTLGEFHFQTTTATGVANAAATFQAVFRIDRNGLIVFGPGAAFSTAFPALKRNATGIEVKLGDDSIFAAISAATAAPGTNTTQLATTAFVSAAVSAISAGGASYLPLAGGTLTGDLIVNNASIGINTTPAFPLDIRGNTTRNAIIYTNAAQANTNTTVQYGMLLTQDATLPATLVDYYGMRYTGSLLGASAVTTYSGLAARLNLPVGFTGTITNGYTIAAEAPTNATSSPYRPYSIYSAFVAYSNTNGNGITTGTVSNRGLWIVAMTAASAGTATVTNEGIRIQMPTGSPAAGTTNNYGLYIGGTVGGIATDTGVVNNYSIFNNATADVLISDGGKVAISPGTFKLPQATLHVGGATAATARSYHTNTDVSNYAFAYMGDWGHTTDVATYGTNNLGTPTVKNLQFVVGGVRKADYGITTAARWTLADALTVPTLQAQTFAGAAQDYLQGMFALSGGGVVTWAGPAGRLKWTSRFIALPMGRSASSAGYVDIIQPVVNIPAGQVYTGVARTADANGVILNNWEALYAVHTIGGANSAVTYYIVIYSTAFVAPSNWLLVAAVNGDNFSVKLGTGQVIPVAGQITNGVDALNIRLTYAVTTPQAGGIGIQSGTYPVRNYQTYIGTTDADWAYMGEWIGSVATYGTGEVGATGVPKAFQFMYGGVNKLDYGVTTASTWSAFGNTAITGNLTASGALVVGANTFLTHQIKMDTDTALYMYNEVPGEIVFEALQASAIANKYVLALNKYGGFVTITQGLRIDSIATLADLNIGTTANPGTARTYNGYSNSTNYDLAYLGDWSGNVARYGTVNAGTFATARDVQFVRGGAVQMSLTSAGVTHPIPVWITANTNTIVLSSATAGQQSNVLWQDVGVSKWQMGKQNDNGFFLYDAANLASPITVTTAGTMYLGESSQIQMTKTGSVLIANVGMNFGGLLGASSSDLSKHISLHSAGYGFGITGGRLNYVVAASGAHMFVVNAVDVGSFSNIGIFAVGGTFTGPVTVNPSAGTSRQLSASSWVDLSGANNGWGLVASNAYLQPTGGAFAYSQSHANIGGIGLAFNYPAWNQASIISSNTVVSTVNATFTPVSVMTWTNTSVGIKNTTPQVDLHVGTTLGTARSYKNYTAPADATWAYLGDWGGTANVCRYGTDKAGATGVSTSVAVLTSGVEALRINTAQEFGFNLGAVNPTYIYDFGGATTGARVFNHMTTQNTSGSGVARYFYLGPVVTATNATSMTNINGVDLDLFVSGTVPNISSSVNGMVASVIIQDTFTGSIASGRGFLSQHTPNNRPGAMLAWNSFHSGVITNGQGLTTGAVTNRIFNASNAITAATGAGTGTITNQVLAITMPNGAIVGGITNNYGIYITGDGGAIAGGNGSNYAIYNNSTTPVYLSAGNVGIQNATPIVNLHVGTVGGTARVYNSFTDGGNCEWAYMGDWFGNLARYGTDYIGSFSVTPRDVSFTRHGVELIRFGSSGVGIGPGTSGNPQYPVEVFRNDTSAGVQFAVKQSGTGDASIGFLLTGTRFWGMGVDNSDADKFKITATEDGFASTALLALDTTGNAVLSGGLSLGAGAVVTPPIPVLLGSAVLAANSRHVTVMGNFAYTTNQGTTPTHVLEIWDITTATPIKVGGLDLPVTGLGQMAIAGHILYIPINSTNGLQIVDVSNPKVPLLLRNQATTSATTCTALSGGYLYTGHTNGSFRCWDVSDPSLPILKSATAVLSGSSGVVAMALQGKYVYCVGTVTTAGVAGFWILDISDPANMTTVATYNTPNTTRGIAISGKYAFISGSVAATGLEVVDISDPSAPVQVAVLSVVIASQYVNPIIAGKYLYFIGNVAIRIIDISNPAAPALLSWSLTVAANANGAALSGNRLYVTSAPGTLSVYETYGIDTPTLKAGSLNADRLYVEGDSYFAGDMYAQRGLVVGQAGIFSRGPIMSDTSLGAIPISAVFGTGLVCIGGNDNTFPALKRAATNVQVRLGDDTALTGIEVASIIGTQTANSPVGQFVHSHATPYAQGTFNTGARIWIKNPDNAIPGNSQSARIMFTATNSSALDFQGAAIGAVFTNHTSGAETAHIVFQVQNASISQERGRIVASNWGVGANFSVNLPQANLHVGAAAATARSYNINTDAANAEWAYMGDWGKLANTATYGTDKIGLAARNMQIMTGGIVGFAMNTAQLIVLGPAAVFTNAFPALRRVTTELQNRLGDDSGFAPVASSVVAQAANEQGARIEFRSLTELTTIAAAVSTNTTIQIPINAVVLAVSARVVTLIPTAANFTIGVTGTPARYGTGILVAAGTISSGTLAGPLYYAAATAIVITPNLTPATATGQVRVTIHYYLVTPPTS